MFKKVYQQNLKQLKQAIALFKANYNCLKAKSIAVDLISKTLHLFIYL